MHHSLQIAQLTCLEIVYKFSDICPGQMFLLSLYLIKLSLTLNQMTVCSQFSEEKARNI